MEDLRLFLHVLAATVWVGGQIVLAALVPALRKAGPDVPAAAARAFSRVAWPAFGVLLLTGFWNLAEVDEEGDTSSGLIVAKLVAVAVSGLTAFLHERATTPRTRGLYGAATGASAIAALLLGVLLHD